MEGVSPRAISPDSILDITLYWLTGISLVAARWYREAGQAAVPVYGGTLPYRVLVIYDVPRRNLFCCAPKLGRDYVPRPRLLQRGERGGHFAAR